MRLAPRGQVARARREVAVPQQDLSPASAAAVAPDQSQQHQKPTRGRQRGVLRAVGLGLITGAADDDCSAIGTYAAAGAKMGPALLWTAPVTFPMMFAVVYLSAKLGQVSGRGLFHGIRDYFPRWVLYPTLVGVLIGNTIEAGADIGGMAAAVNVFVPIPFQVVVIGIALIILTVQFVGSYTTIRNTLRWLALALLAYVGAAVLAKPQLVPVLAGTFAHGRTQLSQRIGVGFLAVPVMTTGGAYDLAQTLGWKYGLHARPRDAKKFYAAITVFTLIGVGMNFLGFNPMHFLVWSGVVQGFSTPPLMLLIMLMTNNRRIMGKRVNGRAINILGWITTAAIFAASLGLVASSLI